MVWSGQSTVAGTTRDGISVLVAVGLYFVRSTLPTSRPPGHAMQLRSMKTNLAIFLLDPAGISHGKSIFTGELNSAPIAIWGSTTGTS
jgi:hypothetical protein